MLGKNLKKSESSEDDDRDYSKLELEHVELLGRLQKTESELNKARQIQTKEEETKPAVLNDEAKQDLFELKNRINEIHRKLAVSKSEVVQTIKTDYDL